MALRPVGKTLSSLTGILVPAVVLWLLLNFAYAPSCGRFGCGYEPAWWPQASADSGEGCPDSLQGAVDNESWVRDRLESITDAEITTGLYYDTTGAPRRFTSGRDDDSKLATEVGHEVGVFPKPGSPTVVDHVEMKVAATMRRDGAAYGLLVINKSSGPCDPEDPSKPYTCIKLVPRLLGRCGTVGFLARP
jgi:hypothetical protein